MKLKGRKSTNVIDLTSEEVARRYNESRSTLRFQRTTESTELRDAKRVIPKKVLGFDQKDMAMSYVKRKMKNGK